MGPSGSPYAGGVFCTKRIIIFHFTLFVLLISNQTPLFLARLGHSFRARISIQAPKGCIQDKDLSLQHQLERTNLPRHLEG